MRLREKRLNMAMIKSDLERPDIKIPVLTEVPLV